MANTGALGTPGAQAMPLSALSSSLAGALVGGGGTSGALGAATIGQIAPQYAGSMLGAATATGQMATAGPSAALQAAELGVGTGYDLASALLGFEGTQLQQQAIAGQMGTAAGQQGLEQAGFGVQMGQYPEQMQQAALANENAVLALQRQGASTGTTGTTGHAQAQATQGAEYGWQQADIFRNQQLAQLQQLSEQLGYGGQQEQYANQIQQLGLSAQQQGLNAQQSYNQLAFGLNQLGVSASPEQYLQAITQAEGGAAQTLMGGLSSAALYGGLPAGFGQ